MLMPPLAFKVPMVNTNMADSIVLCSLITAMVTTPLTVAEPALIFQALVAALVGWFRVTAPFTVSALEPL